MEASRKQNQKGANRNPTREIKGLRVPKLHKAGLCVASL